MSYVVSCMFVFDEAVIYVEFSRMRLEVRCVDSRKEAGSRNLLLNFPKRTVNLTETGYIWPNDAFNSNYVKEKKMEEEEETYN